jgi:hypothetical protein
MSAFVLADDQSPARENLVRVNAEACGLVVRTRCQVLRQSDLVYVQDVTGREHMSDLEIASDQLAHGVSRRRAIDVADGQVARIDEDGFRHAAEALR